MLLWNAKWAKQGKYRSESPNPTATDIPSSTANQRPGETDQQLGNRMLSSRPVSLDSSRGAAPRTQTAVGTRKPCCVRTPLLDACHGGRATKKVTGWGPLCSKADTSFTQRAKMTLTLLGTSTVCSKFQTTWETRTTHLSPHLGKNKSLMPRMQHSTEQAWSAKSKRGCYVPEITQEIHGRTEISQVPNLECSLVFLPPCQ